MSPVIVKIRKLRHAPDIPYPMYMTPHSAGMDMYADIDEEVCLHPLRRALVGTGIAIALPDGFEAQIRPRSGLALKNGVTLLNSPGTIDADYRGEISLIMINLGDSPFVIRRGERIGQMLVSPVCRVKWEESETLDETERGSGGFGHTGR